MSFSCPYIISKYVRYALLNLLIYVITALIWKGFSNLYSNNLYAFLPSICRSSQNPSWFKQPPAAKWGAGQACCLSPAWLACLIRYSGSKSLMAILLVPIFSSLSNFKPNFGLSFRTMGIWTSKQISWIYSCWHGNYNRKLNAIYVTECYDYTELYDYL